MNLQRAHAAPGGHSAGPGASHWLTDSHGSLPLVAPLASQWDALLQATAARATGGASPAPMSGAAFDWLMHLAMSPGTLLELTDVTARQWQRLQAFSLRAANQEAENCIDPLPQDKRFNDGRWRRWPYNIAAQSFLLGQQWAHRATAGVPGVSSHHADMVTFAMRQFMDMFAPSNFVATNPVVTEATLREAGMNLFRGAAHWLEDAQRQLAGRKPIGTDDFPVGVKVALTPGSVVFRNGLMELIQYAPTTASVHPEPVLIVPAWIMKYYILDLQPHNSLVKFLVDHGHTVFMISWKNPAAADRDVGMNDYLRLGPLAALTAIRAIAPGRRVHAAGYCVGGTLLAIAAASLAKSGARSRSPLATVTLLAAQVDFTEPGELSLFIDEAQISFMEQLMRTQGYLDASQMAGAFMLLRSNDLIWSARINHYLLGKREPPSDLMAWNADSTRLPYRMHSEYLRSLFLHNELATGRYQVDGRPVAITDIRAPIFAVGTTYDHVAPWRSVYKIHLLTDTDVTFVLASGGHNVGIVAAPGNDRNPGRGQYQIKTHGHNAPYLDAEAWHALAAMHAGSWWPAWQAWLADHSGRRGKPPSMGAAKAGFRPLAPAPGTYVLAT
ncbi:MAG: alpha/beta fold hydrolase [Betaproteobacteria bacterium]